MGKISQEEVSRLVFGGYNANVDFLIYGPDSELVAGSIFSHSGVVRNICASMSIASRSNEKSPVRIEKKNLFGRSLVEESLLVPEDGYRAYHTKVAMDLDSFHVAVFASKAIGKKYLITTKEKLEGDLYELLMQNYDLPLSKDWMNYLIQSFLMRKNMVLGKNNYGYGDVNRQVQAGEQFFYLNDLLVYRIDLDVSDMEAVISQGLSTGKIHIGEGTRGQKPMEVESLDDYLRAYGSSVLNGVKESMEYLTPINGRVDNLALLSKTPYSQQGAVINGMVALLSGKERSGILLEQMGCGKTMQALSVQEAMAVKKWLKKNPGKTVRDCYLNPEAINYRDIILCPGHLTSTWKEEVESCIPYAKVKVIEDFKDVIELGEKKKPVGREYYIIAKDFAKLSYSIGPRPERIKKEVYPRLAICEDCFSVKPIGAKKCPHCGGGHFKKEAYGRKTSGLVCPECGELLLKKTSMASNEVSLDVFQPEDFAKQTSKNKFCYHCHAPLWGADCPTLGNSSHQKAWLRVSHFKNMNRKTRETEFMMKGREKEFFQGKKFLREESEISSFGGIRKFSPARYMLKHFSKGFFDLCILDEAHLYEQASGQGQAAQCLSAVSKKVLALTGTISNGTASSMFYLLWILDSRKMRQMGWSYGATSQFIEKYGVVQEEAVMEEDCMGKLVRKQGTYVSKREKPGISPLFFTDFLIERAITLELSDFSDQLPAYKEIVESVEAEPELMVLYQNIVERLKELMTDRGLKLGQTILSTYLQLALNYVDKPYERRPIMHPYQEDTPLLDIPDFSSCKEEGYLLNKEKRLVSIVERELKEGRNLFIYLESTGYGDARVVERVQKALLTIDGVKSEEIAVLDAASPKASKRKDWLKQKASEGVRIFVCNPRLVETGLDFIFEVEDTEGGIKRYNFPTIIFYQIGTRLSTNWQAAHRSYRLIQDQECRVYYMVTEQTLQVSMLELMASKQACVSAIQGSFSSGALEAMASGLDPRIKLAKALASGDMGSIEKAKEMFAVSGVSARVSKYAGFTPAPDFYELTGMERPRKEEFGKEDLPSLFDAFDQEERFSMVEDRPKEEEGLSLSAWFGLFEEEMETLFLTMDEREVFQSRRKKRTRKQMKENRRKKEYVYGSVF